MKETNPNMHRGQKKFKRLFFDKLIHPTPEVPPKINPEVLEFTSDVYTVPKGGTFTLRWKVQDVTSIELHKNGVFETRFNSYQTSITKTAFFDLGVKVISYKLVGYKDGEQIESLPVEITLKEKTINAVQRPGPVTPLHPALPADYVDHSKTLNGHHSLPEIRHVPAPGAEQPNEAVKPNGPSAEREPEQSIHNNHSIGTLPLSYDLAVSDPETPGEPEQVIYAEHPHEPVKSIDPLPVLEPEPEMDVEGETGPVPPVDPLPLWDPAPAIDAEPLTRTEPVVYAERPHAPVQPVDTLPATNDERLPGPSDKPMAFTDTLAVTNPGSTNDPAPPVDSPGAQKPFQETSTTSKRKSRKFYVIGMVISILAIVLIGLAFWRTPAPAPEKPVISISGVNPRYIFSLGEPVTITGNHFPPNAGNVKVLLNNVPALIRSQSEQNLVVNFPDTANHSLWKGSIKIAVIINNDTLYTPQNVLFLKNLINTSGENEDNSIPGLRKPDEPAPATITDKE